MSNNPAIGEKASGSALEHTHLISQGYLPPAGGFCPKDFEPTWKIESVAAMLGLKRDELIRIIVERTQNLRDERCGL